MMSAQEITALVTTVGFPIAVTYVLWIFVRQRTDASEKSSAIREEAAERRERQLAARVNELENRMEGQLVSLVTETKEVCRDARDAILRSTGITAACTAALDRLQPQSERRSTRNG